MTTRQLEIEEVMAVADTARMCGCRTVVIAGDLNAGPEDCCENYASLEDRYGWRDALLEAPKDTSASLLRGSDWSTHPWPPSKGGYEPFASIRQVPLAPPMACASVGGTPHQHPG